MRLKAPLIPENEEQRIATLQSLNVLDTESEERFDRITRHISHLLNVPIALVSLVDTNRQWFKSSKGLGAKETSREISICGHAILQDDVLIIPDTLEDERFADNPLVTSEPFIRFYAGCPLKHANGSVLGTLCVIDSKPNQLSEIELNLLKDAAKVTELEMVNKVPNSLDPESGLSNLEGFFMLGRQSMQLCQAYNLNVSLTFLFVKGLLSLKVKSDHVNYQTCISIITRNFKQHLRSSDIMARYDDSSFVALQTNISETDSLKLNDLVNTINKEISTLRLTVDVQVRAGVSTNSADRDLHDLLFDAYASMHQS